MRGQLILLGVVELFVGEHERGSTTRCVPRPRAVDPVLIRVETERPRIAAAWLLGEAAEEEGEIVVRAGVAQLQPRLVEADVVADPGAIAAAKHVGVGQQEAVVVVEDVLDRVVGSAEVDDGGLRFPVVLAGYLQVGVPAREGCAVVVGGRVGEVERVVDFDAAAPDRRVHAHGNVVGGRKRGAMGGGAMGDEGEEGEEDDGEETW